MFCFITQCYDDIEAQILNNISKLVMEIYFKRKKKHVIEIQINLKLLFFFLKLLFFSTILKS